MTDKYYHPYTVNVVVWEGQWHLGAIDSFYRDANDNLSGPILIVDEKLLPNLLVKLQVYPSTSKSREAGRKGEISEGWYETKANKHGVTIYTLNCRHPHQYLTDSYCITQTTTYCFCSNNKFFKSSFPEICYHVYHRLQNCYHL